MSWQAPDGLEIGGSSRHCCERVSWDARQARCFEVSGNQHDHFDLTDTQLGFLTGIAFALFYSVMGIPIARFEAFLDVS